MRVLILVHSLATGGAERVAVNMANRWHGLGWEITLVTTAPASSGDYVLEPGVTRVSLDLASESRHVFHAVSNNLRRHRALRRVLRDRRPDVALGVMTTANVHLALACRHLPIVCVGSEHVHPSRVDIGVIWSWLRRLAYGRLDALVALTRESEAWFRQHTRATDVRVIPNPVTWPLPDQAPRVDPASVGETTRKRLLTVGRLSWVKGHDRLLDAFAALAPRHPDWELVIVGDGPEKGRLEERLVSLGLAGRAFLAGRVGNVADWYRRASLFVLTSRHEEFPNVLLEALAHGLPVVSFDCEAGPRHIVRGGVDGLLVRDQDVAGLVAALDRLMLDATLRGAYASRAVEARERFSEDRVRLMWEALFDDLRDRRDT